MFYRKPIKNKKINSSLIDGGVGAVVSGINILVVLRAHLCSDSYYRTVFYVCVFL